MHVVQHYPIRRRIQRRMYLPSERMVVNGVGLGTVDGFNIGKMFDRMFTFKKSSFSAGNIMGAIGSGVSFLGTFGLSSALAPKTFSAHSSTMKKVGMGVTAAAAAAGAYYGGGALLKTGIGQTVAQGAGTVLKTVGGFVKSNLTTVLKTGMQLMGGSGGGGRATQEQYNAMTAQQQQEYILQQQQLARTQEQLAYEAQLRQEAEQYGGNVANQLTPTVYPQMDMSGNSALGPYAPETQLQSPYSPLADETMLSNIDPNTGLLTDPATGNKIDPATGRIVQAGMFPQLSTTTWVAIGGATLLGWYLMTSSKNVN